jgi:hypothetical protein
MNKPTTAEIRKFVNYVGEFYGAGGCYDFGATEAEIALATKIRLLDTKMDWVADSFDREKVRDIMLENREDMKLWKGHFA